MALNFLIAKISGLKKEKLDQNKKIIALESEIGFLKRGRKINNFLLFDLLCMENEDANSKVINVLVRMSV